MHIVTITEIKETEKPTREYMKIADSGNPKDNGPIYEYVTTTNYVKEENDVYRQAFDELDVTKVVNACNSAEMCGKSQ